MFMLPSLLFDHCHELISLAFRNGALFHWWSLQLVVEGLTIALARMVIPFLSTIISLISYKAISVVFMPS
jgi:hypothetical protein